MLHCMILILILIYNVNLLYSLYHKVSLRSASSLFNKITDRLLLIRNIWMYIVFENHIKWQWYIIVILCCMYMYICMQRIYYSIWKTTLYCMYNVHDVTWGRRQHCGHLVWADLGRTHVWPVVSIYWAGDLGRTYVWRVVQYIMGRRSRENTCLACRTVHNGQEI